MITKTYLLNKLYWMNSEARNMLGAYHPDEIDQLHKDLKQVYKALRKLINSMTADEIKDIFNG